MLGNMKFISRVQQDISLVRFAHLWDIVVNTRNKFLISSHPCIILHHIFMFPYKNSTWTCSKITCYHMWWHVITHVFTCDDMWFWNMFMWNFCKGQADIPIVWQIWNRIASCNKVDNSLSDNACTATRWRQQAVTTCSLKSCTSCWQAVRLIFRCLNNI